VNQIIGPQKWIIWWAVLTAAAFLKDGVRTFAAFLRDQTFFSPKALPFSFASGLNDSLAGLADYLTKQVKFDPAAPLAQIGATSVPNYVMAFFIGALLLGGAIWLYLRALASQRLADDLIALLVLYFVLRIEEHIIAISKVSNLSDYGKMLVQAPAFTFLFLTVVLFGALFFDKSIRNPRTFWRAIIETLVLGIFLFPRDAGDVLANGMDLIVQFGSILQGNITWALVWGAVGLLLAIPRLYKSDVIEKATGAKGFLVVKLKRQSSNEIRKT
jgi:hypothetical protein